MSEFGCRKRCGWCGVELRRWQRDLCRLCRPRATGSAGIYRSAGGPPCGHMARVDADPDPWPWQKPPTPTPTPEHDRED